jgi:pyruvate formate-lyase activating enzyme-like uncharacterized protein
MATSTTTLNAQIRQKEQFEYEINVSYKDKANSKKSSRTFTLTITDQAGRPVAFESTIARAFEKAIGDLTETINENNNFANVSSLDIEFSSKSKMLNVSHLTYSISSKESPQTIEVSKVKDKFKNVLPLLTTLGSPAKTHIKTSTKTSDDMSLDDQSSNVSEQKIIYRHPKAAQFDKKKKIEEEKGNENSSSTTSKPTDSWKKIKKFKT